ncbi:hypothetical protein [Lysinibacillus fusiformis]|uniref:hypothetical protein n=1 Tax=Lysinibacillus fusiformis TaxID=28031 RepID=UPI00088A5A61|nr:hypothetical protein [Lysinibacillus fusiformis]WEA41631.1 hypothetical protein PWJ66_23115 [Lysinibacillus fusiformis]SCX63518.1 hypothetical protein SAMN02787108_03271 [Lysinibacillus fusiformis]SDB46372.1 hypothetical protein SAMN02787070_03466 [Lysinibacillus fusiformis]SFI73544.1 hypothetical protein SAMN02787080_03485 [Lysinibacillus fusiformis]SFT15963.1 hypothetical protein SAMN02787099_03186 [Lysinibacillus fusiformis]
MNLGSYLVYNPLTGWMLKNNQEMYSWLTKMRNQLTILSYGDNLDNHAIQHLIDKYLSSVEQEYSSKVMEVKYDTYDTDINKGFDGHYYTETYFVNEKQLIKFEKELDKLPGKNIRCQFGVRAHFNVKLNGNNFSTRFYKTLDCSSVYRERMEGRYLFFIDTESIDNELIRNKINILPDKLQSLSLPINFTNSQKEIYIKHWISQILEY